VLVQVNADGLVVRGWYSTLTLAIYGTAEQTPCLDAPCLGITPLPRPGQVLAYSQPRKYDAEDSGEGGMLHHVCVYLSVDSQLLYSSRLIYR